MTCFRGFSNTNIRTCVDPLKDDLGFPCGWKTFDDKCLWRGETICKPIRIHWYIERNIDNLEKLEL